MYLGQSSVHARFNDLLLGYTPVVIPRPRSNLVGRPVGLVRGSLPWTGQTRPRHDKYDIRENHNVTMQCNILAAMSCATLLPPITHVKYRIAYPISRMQKENSSNLHYSSSSPERWTLTRCILVRIQQVRRLYIYKSSHSRTLPFPLVMRIPI